MGVFTRKDLTGIGNEVAHGLGRGERNVLRVDGLLGGGGFGRAHLKKGVIKSFAAKDCQPAILGPAWPRLRLAGRMWSS